MNWQPLTEPNPSGKVLLKGTNSHGKTRMLLGYWVEAYSHEVDEWDEGIFDQKDDLFYLKEGWYEYCYSTDEMYPITDLSITHYQNIEL